MRMTLETFDKWLERAVFAGFVTSMVAEWWSFRNETTREPGDLDDATSIELSSDEAPADPLIPVGYEWRDTATSLTMLAGNLVLNRKVWGPVSTSLEHTVYQRRVANMGRWGRGVIGFGAAMVAWDFLYYWEHRWMHEVRLLWAHHVTHHSSERYNLSTALRQPWSGILTNWMLLPMPLLGFSPDVVRRAGEFNLLYQYWIHTEAIDRLPDRFERVLNTASHHRVHHGANPQYIDKNYGGILIVWDKWFGTFEPEHRRVKYGLTKNIKSFNPLVAAYHEFVDIGRDVMRAGSWKERFGYVFRSPGWANAARA